MNNKQTQTQNQEVVEELDPIDAELRDALMLATEEEEDEYEEDLEADEDQDQESDSDSDSNEEEDEQEEVKPASSEQASKQEPEEDGRDVLILSSSKCLKCSYLVGDLKVEKYFDECHYTEGNKECPASFLRVITENVPIEKASDGLAEAWSKNDMARLAKITEKLSKLDQLLVAKIITKAKEKLASR